jgi:hypothetical protein
MRQFTPWAEAVGGFLTHHEIENFLGNVETVRDIDEDEATWAAFLAQWHRLHGSEWVTSNTLRMSAEAVQGHDRWEGLFIADNNGRAASAKTLGKLLRGHIDRYHGSYVLRSTQDRHDKIRLWRAEQWSG